MISAKIFSQAILPSRLTGPEVEANFILSTDSRRIEKKNAFLALVGEKFDGFDYAEAVIEKGATIIIYQKKEDRTVTHLSNINPSVSFIEVDDTLLYLQEMARVHKAHWEEKNHGMTIALTGSNGKTTHKEMLYHLVNSILPEKVLATRGNLNNHIGVPLTLLGLNTDHQVAIVEMGMNHRHEISVLCEVARPQHGLITNIGQAHIGYLGSMENIYFEKSDLYLSVLKNSNGMGQFVVNADDKYLRLLSGSSGLTTFGENNGDVRIKINGNTISFNFRGEKIEFTNNQIAEDYNLKNLCCCLILCLKLFPDRYSDLIKSASNYSQPSMNRSEWIGNIFLDAYNANPSSMRTSFNSFCKIIKEKKVSYDRCLFILGDMNELGDFAEDLHREMAEYVKSFSIKNVIFIGKYKDFYLKGYPEALGAFEDKEQFLQAHVDYKKKYDWIFMKASRTVKLETLVQN